VTRHEITFSNPRFRVLWLVLCAVLALTTFGAFFIFAASPILIVLVGAISGVIALAYGLDTRNETIYLTRHEIQKKCLFGTRRIRLSDVKCFERESRFKFSPGYSGGRIHYVLRLDLHSGKFVRLPLHQTTNDGLDLKDVVVSALVSLGIECVGNHNFTSHIPACECAADLGFDTLALKRRLEQDFQQRPKQTSPIFFRSRHFGLEVLAGLSLVVSFILFGLSFGADDHTLVLRNMAAIFIVPVLFLLPVLWRGFTGVRADLTDDVLTIHRRSGEVFSTPLSDVHLLYQVEPSFAAQECLETQDEAVRLPRIWNGNMRLLSAVVAEHVPGRVQKYL
jgi:hypothetical protein